MLRVEHVDLTQTPDQTEAQRFAAALRAGALLDAAVLDATEVAALVAELQALQRARFNPAAPHYTEILLAETEAQLSWGTASGHGADRLDRADCPILIAVAARLAAISAALRGEGERLLFSITPSVQKARSFPRFYHQDSPHRPHAYRLVCDLGLERSGEVLDVHFVPRAHLEDATGTVRPEFAHLFRQADFDDHYALTDAEIDARQLQVREATLPMPATTTLRDGHALLWIDKNFYHSTFLRAGRAVDELRARGRSIVLLREVIGHAATTVPDGPSLARLLGFAARDSR
ncbi:MAG: hypothetical protein KC620_03535 [Myxococcales bacterium]|nr:hypothetical protein [Myxococcales bacterium]